MLVTWHPPLIDAVAAEVEKQLASLSRAELTREAWRTLEEFNLNPALALEALFVQLKRVFSSALVV